MDAGNNLADRTLVITRTLEAPRALVFDAFTDPDRLARWWGPDGFSTTTAAFDLRPGGVWQFVMHGPDGRDYDNRVVFDEISAPRRLVFHHGEAGAPPHHTTTITFEDQGARTLISLVMVFPTAAARAAVIRDHNAEDGGRQTLGRLAAMLDADMFVISRRFDAPRPRVWQMWTEAEHLARWWGPQGFTWIAGALDLSPGGVFHYGMRGPKAMQMWGRFVFHEIVPPERLTFVSSFSDAQGGVTRAPWFSDWPLEVFNLLTLAEEGDSTRLVLKGAPINAAIAERDRFRAVKASMAEGFAGTFAALDDYLATGTGRGL